MLPYSNPFPRSNIFVQGDALVFSLPLVVRTEQWPMFAVLVQVLVQDLVQDLVLDLVLDLDPDPGLVKCGTILIIDKYDK